MAPRAATAEQPGIDQALVVAFVAGDREAFRALFEQLRQPLFWTVNRYFSSPADQDEALQEIWLKIYRMRERIDVNRHRELPGWARRVARNTCLDLLRAHQRRREVTVVTEPTAEAGQEQAARDSATRQVLEGFVKRLNPDDQRFFRLCFVEERTHEETAELLGITVRRSKYLKRKLLGSMLKHPPLREVGSH